jgi:membrane protein DedA with SNARE-associated domain
LTQTTLQALKAHGEWALALVLLLGALGVPSPATLSIVATGALVRYGHVNPVLAFATALASSATGTSLSYGMGRRGMKRLFSRLERRRVWRLAQDRFRRNAGMAVFLTRWLVTPLGLAVNLIAGGERYSFARFTLWSVLGHTLWIALYGGLGYAFAASWRRIVEHAGTAGWVVAAVVTVGIALALLRWRRTRSMPRNPETA